MMHDQKKRLPAVLLAPRGPYRIGDVVSASWSMTNFSDRDLAGGRLVLNVPACVDPVLASSSILGTRGDLVGAALGHDGFRLGAIRRGESVNAVFDLCFARETSPPQALSLVLELDDGSTYVSDTVDLVVRARSALALAEPPRVYELAGSSKTFGVALTLENVGETRAERVELAVPVPPGFTLSAVRPSDSHGAGVTHRLPDIPRGDVLDVALEFEARAAIGEHVELDGIRVAYAGGHLHVEPIAVAFEREAGSLSGTLSVASPVVEPGAVVRLDLSVRNDGRTDAHGVSAAFRLPDELVYCRGTIAVDGRADPRRDDPRSIALGTVLGGTPVNVSLYATVVAPLANGETFETFASVDGTPIAPLALTVRSEPSFAIGPSSFELDGAPVLVAGEARTLRVRAANAGTADARGVRVRIVSPHLVVERASIVHSSGAREDVALKPTVSRDGIACFAADIGTVAAHDIETLEVDLRAPDHFVDGDAFSIRGDLHYAGGDDVRLGTLSVAGRCRPAIDVHDSGLLSTRVDPLRLSGVRTYVLRIKNAGLAPARGVSVSLNLPGMLAIEAINGEPSRSDVVTIREIAAGAAVEVPIALRLVESVDGGSIVEIAPIVGGEGISTVRLAPVSLVTAGQALLDEFAVSVEKRDHHAVATLAFRNVGDAIAHHVVVTARDLPHAYVAETTRIGDAPVPDLGGTSLLSRGITLPPIAPGREMRVSYRMNEEAADGARVSFVVSSRTQPDVAPEPLTYRGTNGAARFVAHDVAPATNGHARTNGNGARVDPAPPEYVHVAAPSFDPVAVVPRAEPAPAPAPVAVATAPFETSEAFGLAGYLVLDAGEVERIRRIAETALAIPGLGTYRHFFALRAIVPRNVLGASPAVRERWDAVHRRASADLRAPFLAATMPNFIASSEWAETFSDDDAARVAAGAIEAIRLAERENVPYSDAPIPDDQVRGAIGHDFESYLGSMPAATGNALNLILAEAIPTEAPRDPHLSKSLRRYRERLKLLFAALLYQTPAARHERMLSGLDGELDDTLHAIVDRLRDPRWA